MDNYACPVGSDVSWAPWNETEEAEEDYYDDSEASEAYYENKYEE